MADELTTRHFTNTGGGFLVPVVFVFYHYSVLSTDVEIRDNNQIFILVQSPLHMLVVLVHTRN